MTARGRIVAELVPPALGSKAGHRQFDVLVATGVIRPALDDGDPLEGWPDIRRLAGTAAALIDRDRDEASRASGWSKASSLGSAVRFRRAPSARHDRHA